MNILLAFNSTEHGIKALQNAIQLCTNLKKYQLTIINIIAKNPPNSIPYIDHLDNALNLEIEDEAIKEKLLCDEILQDIQLDYEFIQIEGDGEVGMILENYIENAEVPFDLLIIGSQNNGVIQRFVMGSVSDYAIHHIKIPITVVKK